MLILKKQITIVFVLTGLNLFAQQSYNIRYSKGVQKGYIVLKNGDKVKGELKVKGKLRNQKRIIFIEKGSEEVFTADDIDAYVFNQTKFVDDGNGSFIQIIEEGCLNIYKYSYMSYSVGLSSGLPIIIPYRTTTTMRQ